MRFAWSSCYPYPTDPKNSEDIVEMNWKEGFTFDCVNVIDFWMISFALVVTEDTLKEKYVR